MHPFILIKHKEISDRTCLSLGQQTVMGGSSSLPTPGEHSDSDSSGPPSLLWSPWLELGAAMSDTSPPNLVLTLNYQSVLSAQIAVIKSSYCSNPLNTLPYCFSLFPR